MHKRAGLSKRACDRLSAPQSSLPIPIGPLYDPELHPEGCINLSTAENGLITDEMISLLTQAHITPQHLKYRTTLLRSAQPQLADLLTEYVSRCGPVRPITRANSVAGPGVGALFCQLVWALCDPGDGVLLSTPYYHDYFRDLIYPAQARPVFAHLPVDIDALSPAVLPILRERITSAAAQGISIKALILCNPHNPIPRCYPVETIKGYIAIAEEFDIHLIADEIFANSTFSTADNPTPKPFISVLSLPDWAASSPNLDRIHVLGGPTKDLGCSGVKAALLVSENTQVLSSVTTGLGATPISGIADAALTAVLRDSAVVDELLEKNRRGLTGAMDMCAEWARFHSLPYIGANAGVYFILDLSPVAAEFGLEGEGGTAELMRKMIANRVHINPTSLDLDEMPHRFRFIFAQKPAVLKLALGRLEQAFQLDPWPGAKETANGYH